MEDTPAGHENSLPLGEGGRNHDSGRMRGGRDCRFAPTKASRRVGGGGCPFGQTEGVYGNNLVGGYRTIAFTISMAYTPSVTGYGP